jgi:uncharacterized membrane protein
MKNIKKNLKDYGDCLFILATCIAIVFTPIMFISFLSYSTGINVSYISAVFIVIPVIFLVIKNAIKNRKSKQDDSM